MLIKIQAHHIIPGRDLNEGMLDLLVPIALPIAPGWTHRVGSSD